MSRRRPTASRCAVMALLTLWLVGFLGGSATPAAAATDAQVAVTIETINPGALTPGEPVTITGTIRNDNDFTWEKTQVYASISRRPVADWAELTEFVNAGTGFSGSRIVDEGTFDEIGELEPGQSTQFSMTVPWDALDINDNQGVHTIGVQVLGTDPEGNRSTTPIGRAATMAPVQLSQTPAEVPGGLILTLAAPTILNADGQIDDLPRLIASVGPTGDLRRLLDLAGTLPPGALALAVDPSLIEILTRVDDDDDLEGLSDADRERLSDFTSELHEAMDTTTTFIVDYAIPDQGAIVAATGGSALHDVIDLVTDQVVEEREIHGTRATWIGSQGDGGEVIRRTADATPVIVDVQQLDQWTDGSGSRVQVSADGASTNAIVRRDLSASLPGTATAATLRQQLLSQASLAGLDRSDNDESHADALVVTAPGWDPGPNWRSADLAALWQPGGLTPAAPTASWANAPIDEDATLGFATPEPVDTTVIDAVRQLNTYAARLASISLDDEVTHNDQLLVSSLLGSRWRNDPATAVQLADDRRRQISADLDQPTIEGPPSFLLSGREGEVPVTISNPTDHAIQVGITVSSSNPQLQVSGVDPVEVAPHAKSTVTIPLDVGQQNTTSLTAQLVTPDGTTIGQAARFNVRSSNTGTIVWVAMGGAAALLVIAVIRRVWKRTHPRDEPDDDSGGASDDGPEPPPFDSPTDAEPPTHLDGADSMGANPASANQDESPGSKFDEPDSTPQAPQDDPADLSRAEDDPIAQASGTDVARTSAWMALGTLVSRITGFLRSLLLIWAIGTGLNGDIFNSANTVPNALYMLVAGGVFNVVLVPQLVRTMRTDDDGGDAYANRVVTLGLLVLAAATVILVLAAPLLVRLVFDPLLFSEGLEAQHSSALWLMYLCVPQVFFYGAFVLIGQILNARGHFGPMMWAPIVNNVVACLALAAYMVMFGSQGGGDGFSVGQSLVLGIGSTLGIVAQAAILIPYLRAAGFHFSPRFDFRGVGLGHTFKLGAWTLATIVVNQIAFIIVNRLGTAGNLKGATDGEDSSGAAVYSFGYIVSQVPHGVVTVSLATAVMPTLAALALAGDRQRFLSIIAETTRTALFLLAPVAVAVMCLGHDLALSIALGAAGNSALTIGDTLLTLGPAIVVYSLMFMLMRAFYATEDTRTPFIVQTVVAISNIALATTLTSLVPPIHVAPMLGLALSCSYAIGCVVALVWVRARFGPLIDASMLWFLTRLAVACGAAGAVMLGGGLALNAIGLGDSPGQALVRMVIAGGAGAAVFLGVAHASHLSELGRLRSVITRR